MSFAGCSDGGRRGCARLCQTCPGAASQARVSSCRTAARSVLFGPAMRAFLLATGIALFLPLAVACSEDDATPAGGAAGATAGGGAGGEGLTAQITPTSDAACPKAPPASGEPCGRPDGESTCVYDATDCQRFDASCRSSVWTVLVVRETTCIARACPDTPPADGEACEESSVPGTNDCRYAEPACGESQRAVCNGARWTRSIAPDTPNCQLTCPDTPPKLGVACLGYAPGGGCRYENACGQSFYEQCSNGEWTAQQGRETCFSEDCPETVPTSGSSCLAFAPNRYCSYPTGCGSQRTARCAGDEWIVTQPCLD